MVKLFCAVVGEERIITIDIGNQPAVGDLKKEIKREAGYEFPSDKLALYLAKKGGNKNGAWMKDDDGDLVKLQKATIPEDIETKHLKKELLLKPTWSVGNYFVKDKNFPKEKVIHVLVDTRGKDRVSVTVADVNSPLLQTKTRGEKCIEHLEGMVCCFGAVAQILSPTHTLLACPEQSLHDGSQYFHSSTMLSAWSSLLSFFAMEKVPVTKKNV